MLGSVYRGASKGDLGRKRELNVTGMRRGRDQRPFGVGGGVGWEREKEREQANSVIYSTMI